MYRALRMPSVAFSLVCALAASNTCSKMDSIRFMVLRLGIRVQVGNKNQKISIQKLSQQGKASWHPCLIWVYRPGDSGSQLGQETEPRPIHITSVCRHSFKLAWFKRFFNQVNTICMQHKWWMVERAWIRYS